MTLNKPETIVVCLVFLVSMLATEAHAWYYKQAAAADRQEDLFSPPTTQTKQIEKVKPKKIVKCKPQFPSQVLAYAVAPECILPMSRPRGWELTAEAVFARTKGHVRFFRGFVTSLFAQDEIDLNSDMGLPDHNVMGMFSAAYRLQPQWAIRYSIMPSAMEGSGTINRSFVFGNTTFTSGQPSKVKWEHLYQRVGLVYDPIQTPSSRVSIFGEYVRINDKLSVHQTGCCPDIMNTDLNMAITGVEFERCLKTTASCSTLSVQCSAGAAFGDDAVGADLSTGLKYSIPMNNGRWGFIKGGYRYLTFKQKLSDARSFDIAMEGGFLQMGFLF